MKYGSYSLHSPRQLRRIIVKLDDEQQLLNESTSHCGFSSERRLTVKQLKEEMKDPRFAECFFDDYQWLEVLSPERLAEVIAQENIEAEIKGLAEAGIKGPFYFEDHHYPERYFLISPDGILELAEKIKAFRAKKQ